MVLQPPVTFVNVYILLKLHNNIGGEVYQLLLFLHVRPANQLTITGSVLWHKMVESACRTLTSYVTTIGGSKNQT